MVLPMYYKTSLPQNDRWLLRGQCCKENRAAGQAGADEMPRAGLALPWDVLSLPAGSRRYGRALF